MKGRCLRSKNGLWEGKESFSPTKIQTLKSHSWKELCNKEKWETGNMTFVLTFGSYIQNVFCSYSAATGTALVKDNMLPESPLKSGISWWGEGHTDFSLTPICSQVEVCSRCLGSDRGWGGNPSRPANTGQSPSPQPARTRLLTGPAAATPGEWREGWEATFLRPSQVHVIVARPGEMVWVRSGRAGPSGSKGVKARSWGHSTWGKPVWEAQGWVNMCSWEARSQGIHNHATSPIPKGV